jgi:two-component system chemotaxis sensor kinase CheA
MNEQERAFLARLRATFKAEADEHVQAISAGLLALEHASAEQARAEQIETVFRHAHSLKGAARAVNLEAIERICQMLETVFAAWKRGNTVFEADGFDTLHTAIGLIGTLAAAPESEPDTEHNAAILALVRDLGALSESPTAERLGPEAVADPPAVEPPPIEAQSVESPSFALHPVPGGVELGTATSLSAASAAAEAFALTSLAQTVRISTAKLDRLLLEAEEMLTAKQAAAERVADLRAFETMFGEWHTRWDKVQPQLRALRRLAAAPDPSAHGAGESPVTGVSAQLGFTALLEFLEWNCDHVHSLERELFSLGKSMVRDARAIGKGVDDLLSDSKKLLMMPFSTLSDLFPKMVRELGRKEGKEVDLVVRGGEVEIDKRILEQMKDALIHLVRNAIDHGIEEPGRRVSQKKPQRATLTIAAAPVNGNKIEILVADDGAGIDVGRVREAAIGRGAVSVEVARQLDEPKVLEYIFQSGVSTRPIVTDISGRGLGLAIVREQTERLGGRISIETRCGVGTRFRIVLPLTLATFRGLLVRITDRIVVVPTIQLERVTRVAAASVRTVENRETVVLDQRVVSLVRLAQVLELDGNEIGGEPSDYMSLIVLRTGDDRIAFAVDEVLNDEDVLLKSFAPPLLRVRNIAGATVLPSGTVAPILNVADLIKSARRFGVRSGAPKRCEKPAARSPHKQPKVLLAEDSITSRMLLKGILESAGYHVSTAVDGVEAFMRLRSETFDLVVSDVEMPRMNGFDLTERIRADRKLADKPVVLVTALSSSADRERGVEVGANAYLAKSGFDQSNLLDVVRRLVG